MKELGNLAIVCAKRRGTLLQVLDGVATVYVGQGPDRKAMSMDWQDDSKIKATIHELNHGRFKEELSIEGRIAA